MDDIPESRTQEVDTGLQIKVENRDHWHLGRPWLLPFTGFQMSMLQNYCDSETKYAK